MEDQELDKIMKTHQDRSAHRFGISSRRGIATFAAYALVLTTVTFGALPATPAAAAPGDGVCYLIADSGGGNGGNDLLTLVDRGDFNAATNETNIGTGTGTNSIEAMDMHPGTLQLYGANANRLGTLDKLTGVFTPLANTFTTTATPARGALGNINITDVDGLAFNYSTNVLYGSERQSGNDLLVQIDIVTGQIVRDAFGTGIDYVSTNVSAVTGGSDDLDDLAFHPTTGVLYGSVTGSAGGHLVTVNPLTGAGSYIGAYGAGDIEGMRFDAEGFLWGTSGTSPIALYEINITTGAAINPRPLDNGGDYESTVCYVPGSDLFVDKTVDITDPLEGTTVTYTVDVFNAGPADATGVVVEDALPSGVTFVSSTPSQGSYNDTSGAWTVGALVRNAAATLDIVVRADIGTAGSTITNTAIRLAVDQGDAVPNNDSASVDIFPRAAADLAVNKVVSDSAPGEGDTFTYTVTVVNNGPSAATGVTIGDNLPSGVTSVSSDPSTGTYTSGSGIWTVGTLPPGALESLEITATVDAGTALSTITNTASVTNSNQPDPDPTNNSASVDINIPVTGIDVTKVADITGPVSAGDVITYTITVDNTGGLSLNDLVFDDPLPAATSYVSESTVADGVTNVGGSGNVEASNSTNAAISTSCPAGTTVGLNVGSDVSIADVNLGFTATHPWRSDIQLSLVSPLGTSVQLMPGSQTDNRNNYDVLFDAQSANPLNDGNSDNTGAPSYDRTVGVAGLAAFVGESSVGTWTLQICDTYPAADNGTFNQATIYIQGSSASVAPQTKDNAPGGNPDLIDGTPAALVVAGDDFDLPSGSTMTVTYQVQVDDEFDGSVLSVDNTVAITSDELTTPIEVTTSNPIDFNPVVAIVKDGPAGPVAVGDVVTYTYTVDHTAASDGSPVDITVVDDVVDLSAVTPAGDTNSNNLLDRTETWVYTTTYTVPVGTADPLINVATVSGTDLDGDPIDEATDTHSVDVDYAPLLTVAKVGAPSPATVGDTITYTYTVSHSGASDLSPVSNVTIIDSRGISVTGPAGDVNGNSLLDGSETWVYAATETVTPSTPDPLTNGVTVDGTDRDGESIPPATDSETIDIDFAPAVQVDKTGPFSAVLGESVTYTFTVSHAPTSDLSAVTVVTVNDDVAGAGAYVFGDTNGNSLLDGGESWIYTASHTVNAVDSDPLVNTVTVTSTDPDGDPVPDATDNHSTDVEHLPVITVDKTGPASALVGDTVTFSFAVSHGAASDGSPVSNLTVVDDFAGPATYVSGDDGDDVLELGETWVLTASYSTTTADPDPLVNTGTATGDDLDGDPVSDNDTHSTDLIPTASVGDFVWHDLNANGVFDTGEPGLDGVTVNLRDGSGAIVATAVTTAGGAYNFTGLAPGGYAVDVDEATLPAGAPILSTGNEPFSVTLAEGEYRTDADFGYYQLASLGDLVWDDLDGDGIQDAGEPGLSGVTVLIYDATDLTSPAYITSTVGDGSYSAAVMPGDYVVEFLLPGGYVFSPNDVAGDDGVDSDAAPASGQTAPVTVVSGDSEVTVDAGAYVPITIGDYVWDDLDSDGIQDGSELGLGGVTIDAFDGGGTQVGSAVTAPDGSYSISLPPGSYDVIVDTSTLPAGYVLTTPGTVSTGPHESGDILDTADFGAVLPTFPVSGTVWNDEDVSTTIDGGELRLGGVTVNLLDEFGAVAASTVTAGDGTYLFPSVPDASYTVAVDETTIPAGMASTTGNNPEPIVVAGALVADVDFGYAFPGTIDITKNPGSQQVVSGGTADFSITVTNTGTQDLTSVVVSDLVSPDCNNTIGSLAAGASTTYACSLTGATADYINIAAASGTDELGNTVADSDTADVDVINPSIDIQKTPELQSILSGADVIFSIRVENTGDVELTDVTVSDVLVPACDTTFASLAAGAVQTYDCTVTNVTTDFTNTASVTGDDPLGNAVVNDDTADVDVIDPSIDIQKTPDLQTVLAGADVTFTIRVENTGDVDLTDVTVTDALAPACDATFASVAVDEVQTYDCAVTNVTADFTNTASVTGDHAAGGSVSDSDIANVDVVGPAIVITKDPNLQQVVAGGTVTFDISVTNTGDAALTDVAVTDAAAPLCNNTIGAMAIGETFTYSCDLANVAADFTNTASVVGTHPAGGTVSDDDTADVDVINPAIEVLKTPDSQQATAGSTVTFDITVTNTGDVDLTDVTVTDTLAPACDASFASLTVGAVETYTCTMTAGALDYTNIASVTGDDPLGDPVTDTDTADVDVIAPAITIEKGPVTQEIAAGGTATFDITVTNSGDVDLTNVTVTDTLAPACDNTIGALAVGAATTYSCDLSGIAGDMTNTASVTGDDPLGDAVTDSDTALVDVVAPDIAIQKSPNTQQVLSGGTATFDITVTNTGDVDLTNVVVSDPLTSACDATFASLAVGGVETYTCALAGVTTDFANIAVVAGEHPSVGLVTASDVADVDVVAPAIDIQKTPDTQTVATGADAAFTITVTNTGDVDLTDVVVTDALAPACDATYATLAAGAVETYTCTVVGVTVDFTNTASVTGDDPFSNPVTDSDTADVDVIDPSIVIEKGPDTQQVTAGGAATFDITVTNTGDVDLVDVTVTDALAPACDATYATLAAGAVETYTCTATGVTDDLTNTASVTGDDPLGNPVTDSDTAVVDVIAPAITIEKGPDTQQATAGSSVTFDITVTNTGDVDLTDVTVTDALAPACDATYATLTAGAVETYTCTVTGVTDDFTNTASVTGDDPLGNPVTDSDTAVVDVVAPAIDIQKTPDLTTVLSGADVTFTIQVENTGDVALTDAIVSDAVTPACDATFASLAVGAVETYDCTVTNVTADFTNVAAVVADTPTGGSVSDSDDAVVDVVAPAITIEKSPNTQEIVAGGTATFTITVTNAGDVALSDVAVADPLAPLCNSTIGVMTAGEIVTYSCDLAAILADMTNTASVVGTHPAGGNVSDDDTADVDVVAPSVSITKNPASQTLLVGEGASFTITVVNTGDVALSNVVVTDALVPACDNTFITLAAGATESYTCTLDTVPADFTNVVVVAGTHPAVPGLITDSDAADVDVVAPAIDIEKTPDLQTVVTGSDVTFTIRVENTGDVDLTNVVVADAVAPACDATFASMLINAVETYTCTVNGVTADFTNSATVVGDEPAGGTVTDTDTADVDVVDPAIDIQKTPDTQTVLPGTDATFTITVTNTGDVELTDAVVSDPLAPACDSTYPSLLPGAVESYTCTVSGVAADFTNTASVVADDPTGGTVSDSDTANVVVVSPGIDIQKTPDTQTIVTGADATFTITVTNTGTTNLTDVAVTDAQVPACDNTIGDMAAGAVVTYSCTVAGVAADFTNSASVVGTPPLGGDMTDTDTAVVDVIAPAIDIVKDPTNQQILVGGDATFTITVTNTGDVDLTDVAVSDPLAPLCDSTIGDLAAGDATSYSCSLTGISTDMTNTASVAGTDPLGAPVSDSDSADVDVVAPAITIAKTPDAQQVLEGATVTFDITVTNAGDVELADVTVTDAVAPNCDATFASLAAGAVESYSCTMTAGATGFTNTAAVTGDDPLGNPIIDSDTADVDVIAPAITLVKDPATQQILSGEDANFTITVTNNGDSPLTDVTITDPQAPACDAVIPALGVGGSSTVTCSATGVTSSFTNTASVLATHGAGGTVNASDTADVEVLVPAVDIQKSPDTQIVASGGTVTFDITVTNAGVVPLSNVAVTDALAPACDSTIGALAVGASTSYACSLSGVTADFTNTAAVAATDAVGNPASDTDTAAVDVVVPAISIAKSPDLQTVVLNGEALFSIEVTNTGDIDLANVVVTDAVAPACDATFATLAVGESTTYPCSLLGIAADFTNTASVVADHAAGGTVSDSDTADVTVLVPAIDIQKTPDSQLVGPSGTATFTIAVSNAGATPLSNVVVTDAAAPACDATFAALAVGATESYQCTVPGVTADFTNTAGVTAEDPLGNPVSDSDTADVDFVDPAITLEKNPALQTLLAGEDASFTVTVTNSGDTDLSNVVVTDAQAPGCDATFATLAMGASETVTCSVSAVAADFTNTASVVADTPLGTTVTASDDALVDVVAPGVDIQKTPDVQQLHAGGTATFTITVTNNGDQDLADLVVTDPLAPNCDSSIGALVIGDSTSYTCTVDSVPADFTNIAAVAGTDALGNPVSDSDDAAVDVIAPAIDIQKTPDAQSVVLGGTATFDITVTNTGDVDLAGVAVSDPAAPGCDATLGVMAAGEVSTYTCTLDSVSTDFTNTASVSGSDPVGLTVSDSDTADVSVLVPAIDVQKTPDLQQARVGDTVDFTITVTNAGETSLTNVVVSDPLAPGCDAVIGDMVVGESSSVICSTTVTADFTNTASVSGDDPLGSLVTDSDAADVDVIAPAISISKSPDGQAIVTGGSATFTIEVSNIGDVALNNVAVTDAAVPACDAAVGDLAVGVTSSYTCTVIDITADFTNTASVVGTDPVGLNVTDSDTADVIVLVPGLDIQKTPDTQNVVAGDDATFTIIVTNIGQTDLSGVTVSDPLAPACDNVIGDLPVGSAPVTYTCTVTANNSFTNTASVMGDDPLGNPLTDSDTADVVALLPSSITGTIAHDVAGDGAIDGADTGLGGVDVTATWAGLDGVFGTADDEVFVVQTDTNGDYSFNLVPPGDYQVVVDRGDLPAGIDFQTVDPDSVLDDSTALTLPADTVVADVDFAYTATGSIGDSVFIDLDGNGTQEPGEPGIGGVDVTVTWHGPDGVFGGGDDLVFTTTTASDGTYLVAGLPAGGFTVVIDSADVPVGLSGDPDQTVVLGPAEARDDVDFPLVGSGSIGDQVFEDLNHNGVFGSGEPGVSGAVVTLTWAGADGAIGTADDVVITTTTDGNGQYVVTGLPAGEYLVELDETTIPADLGTAPPVTILLPAGDIDMTADFPLVGNRPPVAVDDSDVTDQDTPVVITVLDDDSDPDGHDFAISDTTPPANGSVTVNPDGTITYTPNSGFVGTDTFTYTICELDGTVGGIPATGLCDTATVTVTIDPVNQPPGPDASFQSVVVGDPLSPIPVSDPEGGPVTVTYISGELPPGITMNPDGTFSGVTTEIGTYTVLVEVCDSGDPQVCIEHTHTIAVTPLTLPGPDDPDPDEPPDTLPFTGANFGELFMAALMMLLSGAALVLFARKREQQS